MDAMGRWGLGVGWALFAGLTAWQIGHLLRQVTYVTLADGRRRERRLPVSFRLLLPLTANLARLAEHPALTATRMRLTQRIVSAGFAGLITAEELLALCVLSPLVLGVFAVAALWLWFSLVPGRAGALLAEQQGTVFALVLIWFAARPVLWLRRRVLERHRSVQRALPFVLDLLTLSVEAGLDFMNALERIVERRDLDALGEELLRVLGEMRVGKTRRSALQDMAERVNQPDVRSVVNALVQADELGVGIASILRIQADQMRTRRFERAETLAHQAPVKLLFPLVAFIVPAVFLVLMGPIVLQLLRLI